MLPVPGAAKFAGPNPEYGALITYHLSSDPPVAEARRKAPVVKIKIQDASGQTIRELEGPDRKGINRVAWDLRHALGIPFQAEGGEGWFGIIKGPFVLPGEYTVTLTARGREVSQKVTVRCRSASADVPESLRARTRGGRGDERAAARLTTMRRRPCGGRSEMETIKASSTRSRSRARAARRPWRPCRRSSQEVKEKFRAAALAVPRFQITDLGGQLQASIGPPTEAQIAADRAVDRRYHAHTSRSSTRSSRRSAGAAQAAARQRDRVLARSVGEAPGAVTLDGAPEFPPRTISRAPLAGA